MGTDRDRQQQGSQGKRCAEKAEHGMGQHTFRPYRFTVRLTAVGRCNSCSLGIQGNPVGSSWAKSRVESITDAVHQSTAPAFILAAIGATLNALIARHARVFEAMREISSIEGDPDLLNHAMALMLSRYRLLGNAIRFALGSAASMCALVIATFVDVTQPLNLNVVVAAGFFSRCRC